MKTNDYDLNGKQFSLNDLLGTQRARNVCKIEISYRFGCERPQFAAQGDNIASLGGMVAVGKKYDERFGIGINPYGRAGPAGMAVGADWEKTAAWACIGRINVPSQPVQDIHTRRTLRAGH